MVMNGWSQWSPCTQTCGKGAYRIRQNFCFTDSWDGDLCPEVKNMSEVIDEKQFCSESLCPEWGGWSIWSICDYLGPCPNKGIRIRDRSCHFGEVNDLGCIGIKNS